MNGKDVVKLAADLAAGSITTDLIREKYGDGMLTAVLGIGAGIGVGVLTNSALDVLDKHTGIVSDVGGLIDDVFDLF